MDLNALVQNASAVLIGVAWKRSEKRDSRFRCLHMS
jgi:hypothetical protein